MLGMSLSEGTLPATQYVRTGKSLKSDLNGECTSFDSVDINSSMDPLCMSYVYLHSLI